MSTPRKIASRRASKSDRVADALELLVGEVAALNTRIARGERAASRREEVVRELVVTQSQQIAEIRSDLATLVSELVPPDRRKTIKMQAVRGGTKRGP